MVDRREHRRLSKAISHALRHAPEVYGLALDEQGWVNLETLIDALRLRRPTWRALTLDDIQAAMQAADKQRFDLDLQNNRIRAYYGHSLDDPIQYEPAVPPDILYHGTVADALDAIRRDGLKPMRRQYVHLSTDHETAWDVGNRRHRQTVILVIRAREAHEQGVRFFHGNQTVWLAEPIPARFIEYPDD
jgi:putative RNA 2'-phosphotransferase